MIYFGFYILSLHLVPGHHGEAAANPDAAETQPMDIAGVVALETPRRVPSDLSVGTKRALFQSSKPVPKDEQETESPATISTATPSQAVETAASSPTTTTTQSVVVGAKACHPNANLSLDDYIVEEDPSLLDDLQQNAEKPPREACRE